MNKKDLTGRFERVIDDGKYTCFGFDVVIKAFAEQNEQMKKGEEPEARFFCRESFVNCESFKNVKLFVFAQIPDKNSLMTKPYLAMYKRGEIFPTELSCESHFANDWFELKKVEDCEYF